MKVNSNLAEITMRWLFLFLITFSVALQAQTITGHVYNSADGEPLQGASVYLDGTTFAATTDAEGFFRLSLPQQYNASLIVSYLGFDRYNVSNPYTGQPLKIMMLPNAVNLKTVEVTGKSQPFTREEMLIAFRQQFLGTSAAAKSCTIVNEKDISFYYDVGTNTFTATAERPVIFRNKVLEYDVSFDLIIFETKFYKKTLSNYECYSSVIMGTSLFRDRSTKSSAYEARRKAYHGSARHLLRTIANNSWDKTGFKLVRGRQPVTADYYFEFADTLKGMKVRISDAEKQVMAEYEKYHKRIPFKLYVIDSKKQSSVVLFSKEEFMLDKNGFISPLDALVFGGYIGNLKIGDLLPADYVYIE